LVWGVWSGFTWLRIGIVGGLLWMRWWTLWFWRHRVSYRRYCRFVWYRRIRKYDPKFILTS
jgi:hypothetical protein